MLLGLTVEGPCGGTRHKVVRERICRLFREQEEEFMFNFFSGSGLVPVADFPFV